MIYLLDTNICIHIIRHKTPRVIHRLRRHAAGEVLLSAITMAELYFGADKSAAPERNRQALLQFLNPFGLTDFDGLAAMVYGGVRTDLERKGTPIGPLDTLIAAHALRLGAVLVTNNVREFSRVPELLIEDWTK